MKKIITVLAIAFTMGLSAQTDTWKFTADKKLHLIVGSGISYISADLLRNNDKFTNFDKIVLPIFSAGVIGAGKEIFDLYSKSGNPSIHDFGYTIIGGVIGSLAKFGVEKLITKKEKLKL